MKEFVIKKGKEINGNHTDVTLEYILPKKDNLQEVIGYSFEGSIKETNTVATKLNEARLKSLSEEYNQYISNADAQFNSNNFDKAIELYTKALALNTFNPSPSEMLNRIGNILQANKLEELVNGKIEIASNTSKRFNFNPIDVTTRKNNYIFIKARNLSETSFTLYVTYGSSNGRSGSFILRIPDLADQ